MKLGSKYPVVVACQAGTILVAASRAGTFPAAASRAASPPPVAASLDCTSLGKSQQVRIASKTTDNKSFSRQKSDQAV